jgi:hypothetical protein
MKVPGSVVTNLGVVEARGTNLDVPAAYEGLILPLRPGAVLEQQARLHDALARPHPRADQTFGMAQYIHGFAARVDQVTKGHAYEDMMFGPYRPSVSKQLQRLVR